MSPYAKPTLIVGGGHFFRFPDIQTAGHPTGCPVEPAALTASPIWSASRTTARRCAAARATGSNAAASRKLLRQVTAARTGADVFVAMGIADQLLSNQTPVPAMVSKRTTSTRSRQPAAVSA